MTDNDNTPDEFDEQSFDDAVEKLEQTADNSEDEAVRRAGSEALGQLLGIEKGFQDQPVSQKNKIIKDYIDKYGEGSAEVEALKKLLEGLKLKPQGLDYGIKGPTPAPAAPAPPGLGLGTSGSGRRKFKNTGNDTAPNTIDKTNVVSFPTGEEKEQ
jgi:hypothetical protein